MLYGPRENNLDARYKGTILSCVTWVKMPLPFGPDLFRKSLTLNMCCFSLFYMTGTIIKLSLLSKVAFCVMFCFESLPKLDVILQWNNFEKSKEWNLWTSLTTWVIFFPQWICFDLFSFKNINASVSYVKWDGRTWVALLEGTGKTVYFSLV